MNIRIAAAFGAAILLAACGGEPQSNNAPEQTPASQPASDFRPSVDILAEQFVKLALGVGVHDAAFVDAYHGPEAWAAAAKADQRPLHALAVEAAQIASALETNPVGDPGRIKMLRKQVLAAQTRIAMANGETFPFDDETQRLYDAVAPQYDIAEFDAVLADVDALLPGEGSISERVDAFRNSLAIPADKMRAVFEAAIAECKRRTLSRYELPADESFSLEFVNDKPWSGYNWYQGDSESLIQINTDLPIVIDRAVDLGCHEGYPGHHTWNVIIERDLLKKRGWIEYSIYPLFSPMSVIAEGSANFGIDLAFPDEEKIAFERDVLFPLAGLAPEKAATLDVLNELNRRLAHSDAYIAREYLDGRIDKERAVELLMRYKLSSRARAEQRVDFIETYRGYVINYSLGRDMVEAYVDHHASNSEDRWNVFETLLRSPVSASDLTIPQ